MKGGDVLKETHGRERREAEESSRETRTSGRRRSLRIDERANLYRAVKPDKAGTWGKRAQVTARTEREQTAGEG